MTLPNFFIVGANKAGTTSLYNYLQQHPEIFMSKNKEPMFFISEDLNLNANRPDKQYRRYLIDNIEDYSALFDDVTSELAIGEASTAYLPNPLAPKNIRKLIPNAKFIAILRNPIERAYSAYTYNLQKGIDPVSDFKLAIKEEQSKGNWRHYVKLGFYSKQIKNYFETFEDNQIKVFLYEDLKYDTNTILKNIFQFLEVDDTYTPDISKEHNVTLLPKNKPLHSILTRLKRISFSHKKTKPKKKEGLLDKLIKQNLQKPSKISIEVRRDLIEVYRQDILKLQDLIDRDLSTWLE